MQPVTEARLRRLCRALATLERPALWGDFPPPAQIDWPDLFELAHRFWLGPALAHAVVRHPQGVSAAGDSLDAYCRWLIEGSRRRHAALEAELARLVAFLNERGIEPLLFKGAAELWREPAELHGRRWMMDLDVLLPAPAVDEAWRALCARGYREIEVLDASARRMTQTEKHAPSLVGPGGVTVELHRSLGDAPLPAAGAAARERAAAPESHPSLRAWQLTASWKVVQYVAHDMLGDHDYYRARVLDLRYAYRLYLLAAADRERIDWPAVERAFARHADELTAARSVLGWFLPDERAVPGGAAAARWLAESIERLNTPRDTLRRQAQRSVWRVMADRIARPKGLSAPVRQRMAARVHRIVHKMHLLARPRSALREARRRAEAKALQHHPHLMTAVTENVKENRREPRNIDAKPDATATDSRAPRRPTDRVH